jgi:gliding motility-associated-like protein
MSSYASHILGGEVGWRCLSDGKYQFYMTVFKDCEGHYFSYKSEVLEITGYPFPKDSNGYFIGRISLNADTSKWARSRFGDTSPGCTSEYGYEYSCDNGDEGTIQQFFYYSEPIFLDGIPPGNGWNFFWEAPCCRVKDDKIQNISIPASGSMLLRATMYATGDSVNANPCIDSSPEFRSLPATLICRGNEFTYNLTAIDKDLDSLVYSWDRPYNAPIASPVPLLYELGYRFNNPTDDQWMHPLNIPSTLDPLSGSIKMKMHSGRGNLKYILVVKVKSYRRGKLIASVVREMPLTVFQCPRLPNGNLNEVPKLFFNGQPASQVVVDVVAGQTVRVPIQVVDRDSTGVGDGVQTLSLVPDGLLFSQDKANPSPCEVTNRNLEPCAYLENQTPFIEPGYFPQVPLIKGKGTINTEFVWATDCDHLLTKTGLPGSNESIFNFVMRVSDDHCPIPALNYPSVTVKLKDQKPLEEPIVKGLSVGLDGKVSYSWSPPVDSTLSFKKYKVEVAYPPNGLAPTAYLFLEEITKYQFVQENEDISVFGFIGGIPGQGLDLYKKKRNIDWYIRMKTLSGCRDTSSSEWSQPARIMELEASPVGVAPSPLRSEVALRWNPSKPSDASSKPYYEYESPTHYYVWVTDSVHKEGLTKLENWQVVGDTTTLLYTIPSGVCSPGYKAFRIEARDTVVKAKQGSTLGQGLFDTLYFSSYSTIDSMFVVNSGKIPRPVFDTIRVLENGDVFFRVKNIMPSTTAAFKIHENDNRGALLSYIPVSVDSIRLSGRRADENSERFVIQGIDGCDTNNTKTSVVFSTIMLQGKLQEPACSRVYELEWNRPEGYVGSLRYQVFIAEDGAPFSLYQTVPPGLRTLEVPAIRPGVSYKFQVWARDAKGNVNISSVHFYTAPATFRTFELVPPPELRCSKVNEDGSVLIYFISPKRLNPLNDSTENARAYSFDYKEGRGPWMSFPVPLGISPRDTLLDSILITGINAQQKSYEFRANTLAGCSGKEPFMKDGVEVYSNVLRSIFLRARPLANDPDKKGELVWNGNGSQLLEPYKLYKDTVGTAYSALPFRTTKEHQLIDASNRIVCEGAFNYYVSLEDKLFRRPLQEDGCISRSNLSVAKYIDTLAPQAHSLDFITFDINSHVIKAQWNKNLGAIDVDSLILLTVEGTSSSPQYRRLGQSAYDLERATIPTALLDARDTSVKLGLQLKDVCGYLSRETETIFHESIDVNAAWHQCDSLMKISWSPYVGFPQDRTILYEIYCDTTGRNTNFDLIGSVSDTLFEHAIVRNKEAYRYYVQAHSLGPGANFSSNSNISKDSAVFDREPRYGYLQNISVLPSNKVALRYYRDTLVEVSGYTIYRGSEKEHIAPLIYLDAQTIKEDSLLTFTDADVDVTTNSYYYRVVVSSAPCRADIAPSNWGRSILLEVEADVNAGLNRLNWSEYTGWDSTVAYYNIYRGIDAPPGTEVLARVLPREQYRYNRFVDPLSGIEKAEGKFCYLVEAVQGKVGDGVLNAYPHHLEPAIARSNVVCVQQQPLFYVPNAFAPKGVNKTFGPKGIFLDYSAYEMIIYNRWGSEVFTSRDINTGWDGSIKGTEAPAGSYIYIIRFTGMDGKEHVKKGSLTLLR